MKESTISMSNSLLHPPSKAIGFAGEHKTRMIRILLEPDWCDPTYHYAVQFHTADCRRPRYSNLEVYMNSLPVVLYKDVMVAGALEMQLEVYTQDGDDITLIKTASCELLVENSISPGDSVDPNYHGALEALELKLYNYPDACDTAAQNANTAAAAANLAAGKASAVTGSLSSLGDSLSSTVSAIKKLLADGDLNGPQGAQGLRGEPGPEPVLQSVVTLTDGNIQLAPDKSIYAHNPAGNTGYMFDVSGMGDLTGKCVTFELHISMPDPCVTADFSGNGVTWVSTPEMSAGGLCYCLVFRSVDGGVSWLGNLAYAYSGGLL